MLYLVLDPFRLWMQDMCQKNNQRLRFKILKSIFLIKKKRAFTSPSSPITVMSIFFSSHLIAAHHHQHRRPSCVRPKNNNQKGFEAVLSANKKEIAR
jgi:hypothetical protein